VIPNFDGYLSILCTLGLQGSKMPSQDLRRKWMVIISCLQVRGKNEGENYQLTKYEPSPKLTTTHVDTKTAEETRGLI
jgi:hypothetical protein